MLRNSLYCCTILVVAGSALFAFNRGGGVLPDDDSIPTTDEKIDIFKVLREAKGIELYALDPVETSPNKNDEFLQRWKILAKTSIKKQKQRKELADAFEDAVKKGRFPAKCFNPRHGMRVESGEKVIDFVVCFQCNQVQVYIDDKLSTEGTCLITDADAKKLMNKLLKDAQIDKSEDKLKIR